MLFWAWCHISMTLHLPDRGLQSLGSSACEQSLLVSACTCLHGLAEEKAAISQLISKDFLQTIQI